MFHNYTDENALQYFILVPFPSPFSGMNSIYESHYFYKSYLNKSPGEHKRPFQTARSERRKTWVVPVCPHIRSSMHIWKRTNKTFNYLRSFRWSFGFLMVFPLGWDENKFTRQTKEKMWHIIVILYFWREKVCHKFEKVNLIFCIFLFFLK